jgi:hypothetical protein
VAFGGRSTNICHLPTYRAGWPADFVERARDHVIQGGTVSTRRTILSSVAALLGAGKLGKASATAVATSDHGIPATAAETTSGVTLHFPEYPPGDVRRYGIIANEATAADANTEALTRLVSPAGAFRGTVLFPNSTGKDIYYLNDIIPFHDGIQVELQGCTLHFSKVGIHHDTNSGFIFAVRDFSIANGSIIVDYQMGGGGTNAGNALTFGNRGNDSQYFSPTYDSQLPTPMGNIVVRSLRIISNTKGGNGIYMIGGLEGILMENIWIDGTNGALDNGIYYEFGWATDETRRELRQTSHAHNMRFSNIHVSNVNTEHGWGFGLMGAYNCWIDGLYVRSAKVLFAASAGESAFFRPWRGVDQIGAKRNITVHNVVGNNITGTCFAIAGAQDKNGSYLKVTSNGASAESDLLDFTIDGFAVDGANLNGGFGLHSSAEKISLRNGRITNFTRGIVTTHDCTRLTIDSVDIFGCRGCGMEIGQQSSLWSPPRQKMGSIRNCFIAGNGTDGPGKFAGVELDLCAAFVIEGNRFGYEPGHDGTAEGTQGPAVRIGSQSNNVVCRGNHTGGIGGGGNAAFVSHTNSAQGNVIQHASGIAASSGPWGQ